MKKAVHFGAGNIGRGFVGEILSQNGFEITFVDLNAAIIDELKKRHTYVIEMADETHRLEAIENVTGINNGTDPQDVIDAISTADIVTTAIGPNILPHIAPLIASGLDARLANNKAPLDVVACENMIGASQFLKTEVYKTLKNKTAADQLIGFPNAAVDRIVPAQNHEDALMVTVEPFHEWIIDESQMKNSALKLNGVDYVKDLEPYIERKLFTVNTGHATIAYMGSYRGYSEIKTAIADSEILSQLRAVLAETGGLLVEKWKFNGSDLEDYQNQVIGRFMNPELSDSIHRIGRTPLRKLGYNERFIQPIRETEARGLPNDKLIETVGMVLHYHDEDDKEAVEMAQELHSASDVTEVIKKITGLPNGELLDKLRKAYDKFN